MNTNATEYQTLVVACQKARASVLAARTQKDLDHAARVWTHAECQRIAWVRANK